MPDELVWCRLLAAVQIEEVIMHTLVHLCLFTALSWSIQHTVWKTWP